MLLVVVTPRNTVDPVQFAYLPSTICRRFSIKFLVPCVLAAIVTSQCNDKPISCRLCGVFVTDRDECRKVGKCGALSTCTNRGGGFKCGCKKGCRSKGPGRGCKCRKTSSERSI